MNSGTFDPEKQHNSLTDKIVVGLERISEAFKTLLWEHAKVIGLSPIQIQLLIFVAYHKESLCNVSHLALEFNLTKPTISDAIKVLEKKILVKKTPSVLDSRKHFISLTREGEKIVSQTENFASPVKTRLEAMTEQEQSQLFDSLTQLIVGLNKTGTISVQRTCSLCQFYIQQKGSFFCDHLQKEISVNETRIDCPEFEGKVSA